MSSSDLGERPQPTTDPAPDEAPGGPADRIDRDEDDFPVRIPDPPRSAQVEEQHVPDEIEQPEETGDDGQGQGTEPGDEPSA